MTTVLVWDWPIRLFHWTFAACCAGALGVALLGGEDSSFFRGHMLLGLAAGFFLALRLILGLVGSKPNRFRKLFFAPRETAGYLAEALGLGGGARRYLGHNPGSALAAVGMFVLVPLLVVTGSIGGGEAYEDLHKLLAYALLAVIAAHLAGLTLHTLRHGEAIGWSMVNGRKLGQPGEGIASAQPLAGAAVLLVSLFWVGRLFGSHDPAQPRVALPLLGTVVQLGESEGDERDGEHEQEEAEREHDD